MYYSWKQSSSHPPHLTTGIWLPFKTYGGGTWGRRGWGLALRRGHTKFPIGKATLRLAPSWVTGRRNGASIAPLQGNTSVYNRRLKKLHTMLHTNFVLTFLCLSQITSFIQNLKEELRHQRPCAYTCVLNNIYYIFNIYFIFNIYYILNNIYYICAYIDIIIYIYLQ